MPATVKLRVVEGRNLPVMDRATNLTDAYVEVRLGDMNAVRTEIAKKTLHPLWNFDTRMEIADTRILQDNALELRVFDHDVLSDDIIGVVYVSLAPLLREERAQIAGWFPIMDTFRGISGELHVIIRIEHMLYRNPFADSSPGVHFFTACVIPSGWNLDHLFGFVEVLLVGSDPEHAWMDNFRSSRTTNIARQTALYSLSGQLSRLLGRKALELGGNAVIGYIERFEFEEKSGIVARGYGTACKLTSRPSASSVVGTPVSGAKQTALPPVPMTSPISTPRKSSLLMFEKSRRRRKHWNWTDNDVMLLTLRVFPPGIVKKLGGIVAARAVRIVQEGKRESITAIREHWWSEVREEIRSNARAMRCPFVIGYTEKATVHKDLAILCATGTGAVLSLSKFSNPSFEEVKQTCCACHVPYSRRNAPFSMNLVLCDVCRQKYVPEVLLCTSERLPDLDVRESSGYVMVQSRVCRSRKKGNGETAAASVSECLPFLEHDMHRQLLYKLRVYGMNAALGVHVQYALGESHIVCTATATAVYLSALPATRPIQIYRSITGNSEDDMRLAVAQEKLMELANANRPASPESESSSSSSSGSDEDETLSGIPRSLSGKPIFDSSELIQSDSGTSTETASQAVQDTPVVVHVDDVVDKDNMESLIDPEVPVDIPTCSTFSSPLHQEFPSVHLQHIFLLRRYPWAEVDIVKSGTGINRYLAAVFNDTLQAIWYKAKRIGSCHLCGYHSDVHFRSSDANIEVHATAAILVSESSGISESAPTSPTSAEILRRVSEPINIPGNTMRKSTKETEPHVIPGAIRTSSFVNRGGVLFTEHEAPVSPPSSYVEPSTFGVVARRRATDFFLYSPRVVQITPLPTFPGCRTVESIGRVVVHCIRETGDVKAEGGLACFVHTMMVEIQSAIRAQVAANGGNALLSATIEAFMLDDAHEKEAYCLVSMCGDAAEVKFGSTDTQAAQLIMGYSVPNTPQ